jgi:hypothetical protein
LPPQSFDLTQGSLVGLRGEQGRVDFFRHRSQKFACGLSHTGCVEGILDAVGIVVSHDVTVSARPAPGLPHLWGLFTTAKTGYVLLSVSQIPPAPDR